MNLAYFDHPSLDLLLAAGGMLVLGAILWVESFHVARVLISLFMAAAGALVGFLAPELWHLIPMRWLTVLIGLSVGLVLGVVGFRVIQAMMLAGLLTVVTVGVLAWHQGVVLMPPVAASAPHQAVATRAATPMRHASAGHPATAAKSGAAALMLKKMKSTCLWPWEAFIRLPATPRNEILALAIGVALVVFLLGVIFPRWTTVIAGASFGFLLLMAALTLFGRWMDRDTTLWAWRHLHPIWIFIGGAILGMAVQFRHVHRAWRQNKKPKPSPKKAAPNTPTKS